MKKKSHHHRRRSLFGLREILFASPRVSGRGKRRGAFRVESLEDRLLLSSDLGLTPYSSWVGDTGPIANSGVDASGASTDYLVDLGGAEGEETPAPDLVAFAKGLAASGAKMYGAAWCTACTAQKQLFEDGAEFLPFVESSNPDRTLNQAGIDNNITAFPTWVFPDTSREVGMLSLDTLSTRAGVAIPTGVDPFVAPIDDLTVFGGSPLHLALNGYDPNGDPLTYTVTSSNPSVVTPTVITGNRSARITVSDWGVMTFQLFEQRVPDAAGRFIELAQAGFYDAASNDPPITIHRAIDNFVFQFGDPTGTGAGGSTLGDFDDQFNPDLQHNNPGGLSWAKAGDDTNDSQVFVIDVPTRYLDFNHSYFGQLTDGDKVRDAITATATDAQDRPIVPINIESIEIFQDTENGIVMLKAPEGGSGEADLTVTATDVNGHQFTESFHVTVAPDPFNGGPYLNDIGNLQTVVDTPAQFQLTATDVEGDAVFFDAVKSGTVDYSFTVNNDTGQISVTPPSGFVGQMQILARVRPATSSDTADLYDSQLLSIVVAPDAPAAIDLLAASDSGTLDSDNVTNVSPADFVVSGVTDGALVRLHVGDTVVGQATATGTTAEVSSDLATLGDGTYVVVATQVINGVESGLSASLTVTIDTTAPAEFTSTPPTTITVGDPLSYDVQNPEEGTTGTEYSLVGAPTGVDIDPGDGTLTWTPTAADLGQHQFNVALTDLAGNTRQQAVNIEVADNADVGLRLEISDTQGTPISVTKVGDDFVLNVYVQDQRTLGRGVFAAFMDILYDPQLVAVSGAITYGSEYSNAPQGDSSTPGLIDEVGAIAGFNELGTSEFLVFSVPMRAIHAGEADLTSDPADILPNDEILVYGSTQGVPSDQVHYGTAALSIDVAFGANDDLFNVDEDSSGTVLDVLANDQPMPGGGELVITGVGSTDHGGTVQIAQDGKTVTYIPAPDFFGVETFAYTLNDGTGAKQATATVQVAPKNDDPTAVNDAFTVTEDAAGTVLDVLQNDEIAPDTGETLSVIGVGATSAGGAATVATDGSHVVYTPAANFFGDESFTYTISDGNGGTSQATATVTVVPTNDPPNARDDLINVSEDSVDNTLDVLANDDTAGDEGETLSITAVGALDQGGTVSVAADGLSLVYTPAPDFFGTERFIYTITDGAGGTAQASVVVVVQGVNDPPTANDDSAVVVKDLGAQRIDPLANDSDFPDQGETLTIVSVGASSAGANVAIVDGGLALTYTPPANFTGNDTFTYTISDGAGSESEATITVDVRDFVPSKLSGFVYVDANNDGVRDAADASLGGVVVTLTGTDSFGSAVQLQRTTNALGFYEFADLAPGDYVVSEQQPVTLVDGIDSVGTQGGSAADDQLTIALAQDVNGTENNFGERGRESRYISLFDFFASTPRDTVLALTGSNSQAQWYAIEGGWDSARSVELVIDDAAQTAALDVADDTNTHHNATLDLSDPATVQMLGQASNGHLLRVVASPHTLFPDAACACGEGEPIGTTNATLAVSSNVSTVLPSLAEGEFVAVGNTASDMTPAIDAAFSTPLVTPTEVAETVDSTPPATLADSAAIDQLMVGVEDDPIAWTTFDGVMSPQNDAEYSQSVDVLLANFFASSLGEF